MPSTPIRIQTFLANVPLFRELAADEIDRIAERTKSLHVDRGTVLFQRGQPSEGFYIVIFGQVKLRIKHGQNPPGYAVIRRCYITWRYDDFHPTRQQDRKHARGNRRA